MPKIKGADCLVFASPLYFWTVSLKLKAFIERFYCIAEEDPNPPLGRYEKYPIKDCALLMTSGDNFFWTFEQAVSYYKQWLKSRFSRTRQRLLMWTDNFQFTRGGIS